MKCTNLYLNKARFFFVILSFILITLHTGYAFDASSVHVVPIKNRINSSDIAIFNVTINETGTYEFNMPLLSFSWFVSTQPSSIFFTSFHVNKQKSFLLYLKPQSNVKSGAYVFSMELQNQNNKKVITPLRVFILAKKPQSIQYPLLVKVSSSLLHTKYLPGDSVNFDFYMENKNPLNIGPVNFTVRSRYFNLSKRFILKPRLKNVSINDYKIYQIFHFRLPEHALPGMQHIKILAEYHGHQFSKDLIYSILPFRKAYAAYAPKYHKFGFIILDKSYIINLTNQGNVKHKFEKIIKLGYFDAFVDSDLKINNKTIVINETIDPYSSDSHYIFVDYKPIYSSLIILILSILVIIILYFIVRSPLIFTKTLERYYFKNGYLYLVFNLNIKNRTNRVLPKITIKDYLPLASELIESANFLKPDVIRTKKGFVLNWTLENIGSRDERLLVYTIKFKLRVFGKMKFNPSELYYTLRSKTYKIISNELVVEV